MWSFFFSFSFFFFSFFFLFKKADEKSIKFKRTPVRLEIPNNIIHSLNINISEEFHVKVHRILPMDDQFVYNDIFPRNNRKYVNTLCGKVVSWYGNFDTLFETFPAFLLIQQQLSDIILCTAPGLYNAFSRKLGMALRVVVYENRVSMISHIASIFLNYCILLDKVETVPHQFPQTCLKNCVTIIIVSST